jgi:predicted component of type VI protein secretion system
MKVELPRKIRALLEAHQRAVNEAQPSNQEQLASLALLLAPMLAHPTPVPVREAALTFLGASSRSYRSTEASSALLELLGRCGVELREAPPPPDKILA